MKKAISILFLLVYMSTALGLSFGCHYCGGHLIHVALLNFGSTGGCKCNPSDMPPGCCKDKILSMKTDDHKSSPVFHLSAPVTNAVDVPVTGSRYLFQKIFHSKPHISFDFVRQKSHPLFLLNKVFRV